MSRKRKAGYLILFGVLIGLVFVHPGFFLLLVLAGVIVLVRAGVRKYKRWRSARKDGSMTRGRGSRAAWTHGDIAVRDNPAVSRVSQKTPPAAESIKDLPNAARVHDAVREGRTAREDAAPVNMINRDSGSERDAGGPQEIPDKNPWEILPEDSIEEQRARILYAIEFCKRNKVSGTGRMRRIEKKIARWGLENQRDIDAFMPEYNYLIEMIKKSQAKDE